MAACSVNPVLANCSSAKDVTLWHPPPHTHIHTGSLAGLILSVYVLCFVCAVSSTLSSCVQYPCHIQRMISCNCPPWLLALTLCLSSLPYNLTREECDIVDPIRVEQTMVSFTMHFERRWLILFIFYHPLKKKLLR